MTTSNPPLLTPARDTAGDHPRLLAGVVLGHMPSGAEAAALLLAMAGPILAVGAPARH